MIEKKSFFAMTKSQMACVPLLIVWPILVYDVLSSSKSFHDNFWLMFWASVLVYLCLGAMTRCLWPATLAMFGAMFGLVSDGLSIKGGSLESQVLETASTIWGWAVLGLFVGLILHESNVKIPRIQFRLRRQKTIE